MQDPNRKGRRFEKGHPKLGGRKPGGKNKRTVIREMFLSKEQTLEFLAKGSVELGLKPRHERFADLLTRAPSATSIALEKYLGDHEWGRPKESLELSGSVELSSAIAEARKRLRGDGEGTE